MLLDYAWIIPILPLIAFLLLIFWGRRFEENSALVAIGAMAISFLISLSCLVSVLCGQTKEAYFHWITLGNNPVFLGYQIDALTSMMLIVVTFIGGLIFVYSVGYMHGDPRFSRFFAYLSLFACSMLGLVLANNFVILYACWEGVGLCSYLLIGFWFERPSAARAAKKAFLVTRTGDVGLGLGIFLLFQATGAIGYKEIFHQAHLAAPEAQLIFAISAVLIFFGAMGKSAQFPLHVWLPDAMEGPTPVSALIHAATMVAAGVYLVARCYPLFHSELHTFPLTVVAYIGAITALMTATIAVAQNDIKRILAYSTLSQLGYMMLGLGVGGYTAGAFHLMTHAFFKALLFMGSGSVIHGTGEQDIMQMGGLRKKMPVTFWTYMAGTLALAGIFPFAGFWSKDEIIHHAFEHDKIIFLMAVAAALLTAFYMFRQIFLVFYGEPRNRQIHAHESPAVMLWPLRILAVCSIGIGWVGIPWIGNPFHHFLHFGDEAAAPFSWFIAVLSTLVALGGIALAWRLYGMRPVTDPQGEPLKRMGPLYTFLANKWYFDELYDKVIIQPLLSISRRLFRFDQRRIDGAVDGVGMITVFISKIDQLFDDYVVNNLVNLFGWITGKAGNVVRLSQTGLIQNYAVYIVFGVLAIVLCKLIASS